MFGKIHAALKAPRRLVTRPGADVPRLGDERADHVLERARGAMSHFARADLADDDA